MLKSAETVSLIGTSPDLSLTSTTSSVTGEIPKREPVTINSEEEWRKFFTEQSNPNTNTTNKKETKREVSKDDNGANIFTARGEHKYNGNDIVGKVAEEVKTEISQSIGENTVKSIRLKEAKLPGRNNVVTPSVRIMLDDNKKAFNMANMLSGGACKKYDVRSVTFMLSDKVRGIRCGIDKDGTKIYEVANGSYQMALTWYVGGQECKIKINIHDNGSVERIEGHDITDEQLKANTVKVGKQYEAKNFYEALKSQVKQEKPQQSSEIVTPLTNVTNVDTPSSTRLLLIRCLDFKELFWCHSSTQYCNDTTLTQCNIVVLIF